MAGIVSLRGKLPCKRAPQFGVCPWLSHGSRKEFNKWLLSPFIVVPIYCPMCAERVTEEGFRMRVAAYILCMSASTLSIDADLCDVAPFVRNERALAMFDNQLGGSGESREEIDVALRSIQTEMGLDDSQMLSQLMYQGMRGLREEEYSDATQWRFIALAKQLCDEMSEVESLRCAVSMLLARDDETALAASWTLLSIIEGDAGGGHSVPYALYEDYFERCYEPNPSAIRVLTDFLVQRNAPDTLSFLTQYGDMAEERQAGLTNANEIAKKYYPKDYRYAPEKVAPTPEDLTTFAAAMRGDAWWLPLYFAEVVRKIPAFQTEAMLEQLRALDHPVADEALRAIALQDPDEPVPLARWMVFQENKQ